MSLSNHDKMVKAEAERLMKQGYKVQADLPGYDKPDGIGKNNYIPDIVAKKTNSTKIIEVETSESMKKDKKQQTTFRRSAAQKRGTTFEIKILK